MTIQGIIYNEQLRSGRYLLLGTFKRELKKSACLRQSNGKVSKPQRYSQASFIFFTVDY